jgi:class 3 adenylate cyclase
MKNFSEHLESLLAESDFANLALTIVERFSTQRPLNDVLVTLFHTIGSSLRIWANAKSVVHVFSNPGLNQAHILQCEPGFWLQRDSSFENQYKEEPIEPSIPVYGPEYSTDSWNIKKFYLPKDKGNPALQASVLHKDISSHSEEIWVAQFDFANQLPLGHFCVSWLEDPKITPRNLQHIQSALWGLAKSVSIMLNNHFPIHKNTYLPSYCLEEEKPAAILFADIRNSTPLFEIARLGGTKHLRGVETLLKVWLEYAADFISASAIGNLHRFTGDGVMATFGEYEIRTIDHPADNIACALAIHAGRYLVESFQQLHTIWYSQKQVEQFYLDYNEEVELRLGIGINYGKIYFGYFGASCYSGVGLDNTGVVELYPGHLEYTAIGDHVNTASRLGDVASKLAKDVDLNDRGSKYINQFRIKPIVVSQTVSKRLPNIIGEDKEGIYSRRGIVRLKGKGVAMPFFEIDPEEIDVMKYIRLFQDSPSVHHRDSLLNPPDIELYIERLKERMSELL